MGNACSSDKSTETKDGSAAPAAKPSDDEPVGETGEDNGVTEEDNPGGDAE